MRAPVSDFDGQTAVVTGASSGIGVSIASTLVSAIASRASASASIAHPTTDATAAAIRSETGSDVEGVVCDVTDRDDVAALVETTVDEFGSLDILENYAGVWDPPAESDLDAETWNRVTSVVLDGTFNCTQLAGPYFKENGGTVFNIVSGAGLAGFPLNAPYGAAKRASSTSLRR